MESNAQPADGMADMMKALQIQQKKAEEKKQ